MNSYVEPLLDIQSVGCALLRLGDLRYKLLVHDDDFDPILKYSIKYSELTKKIASLEIDIQLVFPNMLLAIRFVRMMNALLMTLSTRDASSHATVRYSSCLKHVWRHFLKRVYTHVLARTKLKISVYHNVLARTKDSVAKARFLGTSSFKILHEIFHKIASLWMKHWVKSAQGDYVLQFKFRTRSFKMEGIIDIDVFNCTYLLKNDSFSEWQEFLSEELDSKIRVNEEDEVVDQEWNAQESDLNGIVNIHI